MFPGVSTPIGEDRAHAAGRRQFNRKTTMPASARTGCGALKVEFHLRPEFMDVEGVGRVFAVVVTVF
jgi:hypothetical protein